MAFRIQRFLGGASSVMTVALAIGCSSEPDKIKCSDGYEVVVMDEEYFCTENPSTACAEGFIPVQTEAHVYACTKPAADTCKDDETLVQQTTGTYTCLPTTSDVSCEDGSIPAQKKDGTYACVTINEISCKEGTVAVQKKDGTYDCVTVAELSCPSGSVPNLTNTACTSLAEIVCGDGFVPQMNAKTGTWDCIDASAQDRVLRTASGLVTDCETKLPLNYVKVALQGIGAELDASSMNATTDVAGAFSATGYVSTSGVVWSASLEGYKVKTGVANVTISGDEAVFSDPSTIVTCLEANPVKNLTIAGRVLAGTTVAKGATLYLFDISEGTNVNTKLVQGPITASDDGSFKFESVADSQYQIVVAPYDATGDKVADFTQLLWSCGEGTDLLQCSENFGNLQLILSEPNEEALITYTSLLQPDGNLIPDCVKGAVKDANVCLATGFDPLVGLTAAYQAKWIIPSANGSVVLQSGIAFGAVANGDVELYRVKGNGTATPSIIEKLSVTPSVSSDGLTLTLKPGADLKADQDATTFFELRFRSLAWANKQFAVVPGSNKSVYFDVKQTATYLSNPSDIALYPGEVLYATKLVTDANTSLWLNSDNAIQSTKSLTGTGAGFTIGFTDIGGAASYKVYARVADFANDFGSTNWVKLTDIAVSASSLSGKTRFQAINPSAVTFPAPSDWANQLGYGRKMQVVVTSVTLDGAETPIDPSKALTVEDKVMLGVASVTDSSSPLLNTLAGSSGKEVLAVTFHEKIVTSSKPEVSVLTSGKTVTTIGNTEWSWSAANDGIIAGQSDELNAGYVRANLRTSKYDVCATVRVAAGADATEIAVDNVAAFLGLAGPLTAYAFDDLYISNQGRPITISGIIDRPSGNDTLNIDRLPANAAPLPVGTVNGIAAGTTICVQNGMRVTGVVNANPVTGFANLTVDSGKLYDGQTITVLIPGTTDVASTGGVFSYVVRGIGPSGILVDDLSAALTTAIRADSVRVFRTPSDWKESQKLNLYANTTVSTAASQIRVTAGDLTTTRLTAGDLVVVDVDGIWGTNADRVIASVNGVAKTFTTAGVGPEQVSISLPAGTPNRDLTVNSLLIKLGPSSYSLGLNTIKDTSGNSGPNAGSRYTQFFVCDAAIVTTAGETVCAAGAVGIL